MFLTNVYGSVAGKVLNKIKLKNKSNAESTMPNSINASKTSEIKVRPRLSRDVRTHQSTRLNKQSFSKRLDPVSYMGKTQSDCLWDTKLSQSF
jgi:hypothetical protein